MSRRISWVTLVTALHLFVPPVAAQEAARQVLDPCPLSVETTWELEMEQGSVDTATGPAPLTTYKWHLADGLVWLFCVDVPVADMFGDADDAMVLTEFSRGRNFTPFDNGRGSFATLTSPVPHSVLDGILETPLRRLRLTFHFFRFPETFAMLVRDSPIGMDERPESDQLLANLRVEDGAGQE